MASDPAARFVMADVFDVAEFILREQGEITAMKLQKLVYYSQAWHIAWDDDVLFENRIEAWRDGPVCPDLWREHANQFRIGRIQRGRPTELSDRERKNIRKVLKFYGHRSAQWLSDLTHKEAPWRNARRGCAPNAVCDEEITKRAMGEYYSSL